MSEKWVTIMGSFVADLAFRTKVMPAWGETVMGSDFKLGPGGKGSNQAVAAARLGGKVSFISKLGRDAFGDLARSLYQAEGIDTQFLYETTEFATGGAAIIVDEVRGENAIVVVPGACFQVNIDDIDRAKPVIANSAIFMTQLELSVPAVVHGLKTAKSLNVPTILNPAPALPIPDEIYPLCDYITPNETEAAKLVNLPVTNLIEVEKAADVLLSRGVKNVVVTLGEQGAFVKNASVAKQVAAFHAGPVLETTGAGDAFNGGFAIALSEGLDIVAAARFGCAVAGISVTRSGTAPSMPKRSEVDALLAVNP